MHILVCEFVIKWRVEPTHYKVTVVLILHQLANSTKFPESYTLAFKYTCDYVFQELLVLTKLLNMMWQLMYKNIQINFQILDIHVNSCKSRES